MKCPSRKIGHLTREIAEQACEATRRHDPAKRRKLLRVYKCTDCPYWHVGHTKRRYLKAERRERAA